MSESATIRVKVDVTQDDIDNGCAYDAFGEMGGCMVYRAFMRATEGAFGEVGINWHTVHWTYPKPGHVDWPNVSIGEAIMAFDRGEQVEPFSFNIDIPISVRNGA